MLKPKKYYPRQVLLHRAPAPPRYCANPACGAKITTRKTKYCDKVCYKEHSDLLKAARRPAEVHCAACNAVIDPMSREPRALKKAEVFCDAICVNAYRIRTGKFTEMSQRGNKVLREYQTKHGQVHNSERRTKAVSANNKTHPPRSKLYERRGKVWGYDAHILPNKAGDGYIAHIPELTTEVGSVEASTAKEAITKLRARFLEIRAQERKEDRR